MTLYPAGTRVRIIANRFDMRLVDLIGLVGTVLNLDNQPDAGLYSGMLRVRTDVHGWTAKRYRQDEYGDATMVRAYCCERGVWMYPSEVELLAVDAEEDDNAPL